MIVVVNTRSTTGAASFVLESAERWPGAATAELVRVDGPAEKIRLRDYRFDVAEMAPHDTHVYVSPGC